MVMIGTFVLIWFLIWISILTQSPDSFTPFNVGLPIGMLLILGLSRMFGADIVRKEYTEAFQQVFGVDGIEQDFVVPTRDQSGNW
ncbi:hypothetical protein [Schlesneria paludicola]|uniref:hypothetical protein n=1 Tax=Schlesneria paludicola TaxID=360056 RepID=UPI00030D4F10|nr:hypothetical protein [Schlesneria paludicola]